MSDKKKVYQDSTLDKTLACTGILRQGLPYVNNLPALFLTAFVNLACVYVFYYGHEIDLRGVLLDSFICGVITPFINIFVISSCIERLRSRGALPASVPVSKIAMKLPKNRFLLSLIFAAAFGFLTPLVNFTLIRFYGITHFAFPQLALWKVIYSFVLSAKIIELAILRFVQPDCGSQSSRKQSGTESVKNPLPRVPVFKEWFNTVTDDFGFNMLVGLIFGGTLIDGCNIIILPTVDSGIAITAIILGLIVTARMAYPVAKNIKAEADALGTQKENTAQNGVIALLPYSPWKFALTLALPIILLSFAAFWSVMAFFHFQTLNFFQFFLIRTISVSILSKAVVWLAVRRYFTSSDTAKE